MNHFKEFILAIQTFNLETLDADPAESSTPAKKEIQQYSISRENGYKTNAYRNYLNSLKELAIIDLIAFDYMQIQIFLGRLSPVYDRFRQFWQNYHRYNENMFQVSAEHYFRALNADEYFILNGFNRSAPSASITHEFANELAESIQFREHLLNDLSSEMDEYLHGRYYDYAILEEVSDFQDKGPLFILAPITIVQEAREDFYIILKDYFAATDLDNLKSLIINSEEPEQVLTYNGNGNQLADAFKQLYEANLIVGCTKAQLEKWIGRHFCYISNNQLKHFTAGYLNGIISSDVKKCQSPILDIHPQQDRFVIKPTLRNKKNQQFG